MRAPAVLIFSLVVGLGALDPIAGSQAKSQPAIDVGQAQIAMFGRISSAISAYAAALKVAEVWVQYCQTEANRKAEHETDGSIPFGINWNNIRSQKELDIIIQARENWFRQEMVLCIAKVRITLRDAAAGLSNN